MSGAVRRGGRSGQPAGWSSDTLPASEWLFLPLKTGRGRLGVLGISFEAPKRQLTEEQRRLLEALLDQVAVAIERTNLASAIEDARLLTETERLRAALLSSVSHDLRTPLAAITGAATTLREHGGAITDGQRRDLIEAICEEAERMERLVGNLLDMTRLDAGAVRTTIPFRLERQARAIGIQCRGLSWETL